MDACVGGHGGPYIDADGRCIDKTHPGNPRRVHGFHMGGQRLSLLLCRQCGNEAFQDHRGFPRAGYAGDDGHPPFGEGNAQILHGMNRSRFHADRAVRKKLLPADLRENAQMTSGQVRPDNGAGILLHIIDRPFPENPSAAGSRFGSHFNHPVRCLQDLRIMIHQNHRISVCQKIRHDRFQPFDIRRMKADGRFIQYIQHAGGAVSHRPGQLHPLPLPGGQGG